MELEKKAYFDASCIEMSRESDAEAKKASVKKQWENIVCLFMFGILVDVHKAKGGGENDKKEAWKVSTKIIDF